MRTSSEHIPAIQPGGALGLEPVDVDTQRVCGIYKAIRPSSQQDHKAEPSKPKAQDAFSKARPSAQGLDGKASSASLRLVPAIDSDGFVVIEKLKQGAMRFVPPVKEALPDLPARYVVIETLGQGEIGDVYRVYDRILKRDFAIKMAKPELQCDRLTQKRFQKEAALASELTHPNIAQIFGLCARDGAPYLVMEYVDGLSLDKIMSDKRIISSQRAINIAVQICDALEYAQSKGIVHRDLKPSNILILRNEHVEIVKIVDFGISNMFLKNDSTVPSLFGESETSSSSPFYTSPEKARGRRVDARTDLYSLGCIMFEALSGQHLFEGDHLNVLLQQTQSPVRERLKVLKNLGVSSALIGVVERLLRKDPEKRYQCALELSSDLKRIESGRLTVAQVKIRLLLASLAVVLGVLFAVTQFLRFPN